MTTDRRLTVEVARECMAEAGRQGFLNLDDFESLEEAAAAVAAAHRGVLLLNGLRSLSAPAAQALARHEGELQLGGLQSLDDGAAGALCQHGGTLVVDVPRLTGLGREASDALAGHVEERRQAGLAAHLLETWGTLGGGPVRWPHDRLTSQAAAEALARITASLSLDLVTELSPDAAEEFRNYDGPELSLRGLRELTREAAVALAGCRCGLRLDGLSSLPDEIAEALAGHSGALGLDGLTAISDAAARALGGHDGPVSLDGLAAVSDEAANSLVPVWVMKFG